MYEPEQPPRLAWGMWKRFLLGSFLIVFLAGTTTATAILLEVKDTIDIFREENTLIPGVENVLDDVDAGRAQTILVLGSDRRFVDIKTKAKTRSDTIIIVRLDPNENATAIMSIPRDLVVDIPGAGRAKINAAYAIGGPKLTVRTVRNLLGIPIHHVVNVNFGGFKRAVNRLGCVYADVDRRYFNDNNPPRSSAFNYATIDLKPGYQKLCGQDALDYVRFRHLDSDLIRSARQQEFVRQAKEQIGLGRLFGDRKELLRIFGRYTQTDIADDNESAILRLLKLAYESSKNPLREIAFPASPGRGLGDLTISHQQLADTVVDFLAVRAPGGAIGDGQTRRRTTKSRPKTKLAPGLADARREGEDQVLTLATKLNFDVYFPRVRLARGGYVTKGAKADERMPRSYEIFDRNRKRHRAYRIVLHASDNGQYYGVQGTTWTSPPILDNPTDEVRMRKRTYLRYFDGRRIRLIAWKTKRAAYWVSNTLSRKLTNKQMMDIARSLQRIGQ